MHPVISPFIIFIMNKYYAVKCGRKTGVFKDWSSCEKQVKGFPNAAFKSFKTLNEAKAYLENLTLVDSGGSESTEMKVAYPCAYIDGSYDPLSHRFAYGVVLLLDAETHLEFSKAFDDESLASMRNVAGEIKASEFAIQYALEQNWQSLSIYYDYSGIEKWAKGDWKRNRPATQAYYVFCQEAFKRIDVSFIKVKSHSGDTYNDLADSLARKALEL